MLAAWPSRDYPLYYVCVSSGLLPFDCLVRFLALLSFVYGLASRVVAKIGKNRENSLRRLAVDVADGATCCV